MIDDVLFWFSRSPKKQKLKNYRSMYVGCARAQTVTIMKFRGPSCNGYYFQILDIFAFFSEPASEFQQKIFGSRSYKHYEQLNRDKSGVGFSRSDSYGPGTISANEQKLNLRSHFNL